MKKIIVLALAVLLVLGSTVAVYAKAEKCDLVPCPVNNPDLAGGGFVVFNNSSGGGHNLELTASLKGAAPNTNYDIYLFVDGSGTKIGTVTTNGRGNANFHLNTAAPSGTHWLALDITLEGSGADVYETPNIHLAGQSVEMTFK